MFQAQNNDDPWFFRLSFFNSDFTKQCSDRKIYFAEDLPALRYGFWKAPEKEEPEDVEKKPAPEPQKLAILLPGIGGNYFGMTTTAIAELLHRHGFAVAALDSTFTWQFMQSTGKRRLPGYLPDDAASLRRAIRLVLDELTAAEKIRDPEVVLLGYSFGALHTLKIAELGGKVLALSGPDGYIYDRDGVSGEKIDYMLEMRASGRNKVKDYADKFGCEFVAGKKPWGNVKADIYMPCAMQNEIRIEDAKAMVSLGVKYLNEVSNMPTTNEALEYLQQNGVLVAPSKAVNAGGVAVSGLEMSQNSERLAWSKEEVDSKLQGIMRGIHKQIIEALDTYGMGYNLVAGANLAGFKKVADAMIAQGIN